jgi:uncharacterized protein
MSLPAYQPESDLLPLSDAELEQLDQLLAALPDGALNVEALDGYLSALLLSPQPLASLPGDAWLPLIWGRTDENPDPFPSSKQRKKLQLLVLRHARALHTQLGTSAWEPLFTLADDGEQEWLDAEDWCTGFLLAVDLAPEAWEPVFNAQAELLAPLNLLGGPEENQGSLLDDPAERDALAREVHASIVALRQLLPG